MAYASDRSGNGDLDIWVQQTAGGPAARLTADPTDDHEPDVSPDGTLIAFRSERRGGGIYVVPALGGDARLIAPEGRQPKFSPDGQLITFWTGNWIGGRVSPTHKAYVVPVEGGNAARVGTDLASASYPIWSASGEALVVLGRQQTTGGAAALDWWWVPQDRAPSSRTGVYERLALSGINVTDIGSLPLPQNWTKRGVLSAARTAEDDVRSVWAIPLNASTGRATGGPMRITSGTTLDDWPAVSRDGRVVFAAHAERTVILGLPLDANAGRASGAATRLRVDTARSGRTGISADGRRIVFAKYAFAGSGVWIKDLHTGVERQLAATPPTSLNPVISHDGQWVAYTITGAEWVGYSGAGAGFVIAADGGAPRKVCEECEIQQWTIDGRLLILTEKDTVASLLDITTGLQTPVASSAATINRPLIAPPGRWVSIRGPGRLLLAPYRPAAPAPEAEWNSLMPILDSERAAGWSPDGTLLYVLLERDGFRCLYSLRIDSTTGVAIGEPHIVHHIHEASRQWGSTGFGSAVVNGWFVWHQFELSGNIWMTGFTQ